MHSDSSKMEYLEQSSKLVESTLIYSLAELYNVN